MQNRILLIFSGVCMLFSGCSKDIPQKASSSTTTSVDYKSLSSNLATQFYKSISGHYSDLNASKSLIFSFSDKQTHHKNILLSATQTLCGNIFDTTSNTNNGLFPLGNDTAKTHFEHLKLTYTCDASTVNGYIETDSLVNIDNWDFSYFHTYAVTQHYTVKALDQTYNTVLMNGTLTVADELTNYEVPIIDTTAQSYNLVGLKVDLSSGSPDVVSGTATFKIHIETFGPPPLKIPAPTNDFNGIIEYLGNHKAKVMFTPGGSYIVDLITGVATPV